MTAVINSDNKNNLTAVVESWGYFIGPTFTERKYRPVNTNIANEQVNRLERQRMDGSVQQCAKCLGRPDTLHGA